ncbi:MAG: glycosyltransferase family 39 protein [Candidatus Methanomethyliaceae archaeon]
MNFIVKDMTNLKVYVWELLFIALLTLIVLLPISPLYISSIGRDSGVFLYTGWRIINGEIPYRDIWDHKLPVIFYLNALGLFVGQNSRLGVWFLEFLSLFGAIWLGFRLMKKLFKTEAAVLSSLLWTLSLIFLLGGGNFTTEYTIPLQFAALSLIYKAERSNFSPWYYLGLGFLGGIAFFTKQTAIGVWIAIITSLLIFRFRDNQVKRFIKELCLIASGGFVVVLGWIAYFSIHGALEQFWEAAFTYNFVYTSVLSGFPDRIRPIAFGIEPLTRTGLLQVSGIGYVLGVALILKRRGVVKSSAPVLCVGIIDYPLELILISASGNTYPHYYITLLPVLSMFVALFFDLLVRSLSLLGIKKYEIYFSVLCLALLFIYGVPFRVTRIISSK